MIVDDGCPVVAVNAVVEGRDTLRRGFLSVIDAAVTRSILIRSWVRWPRDLS